MTHVHSHAHFQGNVNGQSGKWQGFQNVASAPVCGVAPWSRDNHLGDGRIGIGEAVRCCVLCVVSLLWFIFYFSIVDAIQLDVAHLFSACVRQHQNLQHAHRQLRSLCDAHSVLFFVFIFFTFMRDRMCADTTSRPTTMILGERTTDSATPRKRRRVCALFAATCSSWFLFMNAHRH